MNSLMVEPGGYWPRNAGLFSGTSGLLSQFFLGYRVTFVGSFIGLAYGFALGFVLGSATAWLYNSVLRVRSKGERASR